MWVSIRSVSVVFRAIATLIVVLGVVLTCLTGVLAAQVAYFTVQSGVLLAFCLGWCVVSAGTGWRGPPSWLKGAATLYVCITGLVSNVVLTEDIWASLGTARLSTRLLHVATPLLAVVDWLLFDRHGRHRWTHALYWLSYPVAYLGFALLSGLVVRWYPYPFLDVTVLGYRGVLLNAGGYAVSFYLLALLLVTVDRGLGRRRPGRPAAPVVLPAPRAEPVGSDIGRDIANDIGRDIGIVSKP